MTTRSLGSVSAGGIALLILTSGVSCSESTEGYSDCTESSAYDEAAMKADVVYLASPELDGRVPGTEGDEAARTYIGERFACLGLTELSGLDGYEQPFVDESGASTANVIGSIPGTDAEVSSDIIVVSAHHDHLGDGLLGANDNASGVSGLLAIAQALMAGPAPARTIVFAAFGAEESGFEGSDYFVTDPPDGLDPNDIVYNINMDMIGSYTESTVLYALGTLDGTVGRTVVENNASAAPSIDVNLGDSSDQSDNATFCERGIPYIFFWTEDEACYHSECDTADRIDYGPMAAIARLTGDVVLDLANSEEDLWGAVDPDYNVCETP